MTITIKRPEKLVIPKQVNLFYLSYTLYLVFTMASTSFYFKYIGNTLFKLVLAACFVLLALRELADRSATGSSIIAIFFSLALLVVAQMNRSSTLQSAEPFILIFAIAARKENFESIAKYTIAVSGCLLAFIILSSHLGLIQNYVTRSLISGRVRQYLGFRYALYPAMYLFNITMLVICVRRGSIRWIELLLLLFLNYAVFRATNSRLSFFLSVLAIFAAALLKVWPSFLKKGGWIRRFLIISFLLCFAVSVVLTVRYNPAVGWMKELNQVLERRLYLGQNALHKYGVSAFGHKVTLVGYGVSVTGEKMVGEYNYVDNLYIQLLLRYGVVITALLLMLLTWAAYRIEKLGNYYYLLALGFMAYHGLVDDLIISLHFNSFWMLIGTLFIAKTVPKRKNAAVQPGSEVYLR